MAIDSVFVSLLGQELNEKLSYSKIEKIRQPAKDVVLFSLRKNRESLELAVSVCPGRARVHLTNSAYENPQDPPMFCMLLRKHLLGALIESVEQPENDRVLKFTLRSADEFGRQAGYSVYIELMNRTPNMIIVGEDGIILDCIHRLDYDRDMYRRLFPGMIYRLPQKNPNFSSFSPLVLRETVHREETGLGPYSPEDYAPFLLKKEEEPFEFSYMPVFQYGEGYSCEQMESFSALLDAFYAGKEQAEICRRKSREIRTVVSGAVKKLEKKLALQAEELERTRKREDIKKYGDLTTANIYRIRKGDSKLVCEDYFEEGCPTVEIPLDPMKSPQANAAAFFKDYRKMKTAEQVLEPMIEQGKAKLDYLRSVLDEIERASSEAEINAIREELTASQIIRARKQQPGKKKSKPLPVLSIPAGDDFEILVGRNNIQNEELTFKTAFRSDYWFHVKNFHGSHVILRCYGLEPPDEVMMQAARAAAEHSKAKGSGNVAVDYTRVKNVKKQPGGFPGRVTYTEYSTLIVKA